ncbi:MAG: molybdenum cofactor biosysynthesis protein [Moraxellaceae bacterium]|nr:MAG: molybdenum cofactor biosysynthesis protein [Moraxellaceae bacterium]
MSKVITAKLVGIAYREGGKRPMQTLEIADITVERGIVGDSRGKPGKRQVTILSVESWLTACEELGIQLSWLNRRANLLIEGYEFGQSDVGKVICVGDARLEITRETDPCRRMDQVHKGLKKALMPDWRGGVCCRVLDGAEVSVGVAVDFS